MSQITYQSFLKKCLVRPNSKSQICRRSEPISHMANSSGDNIYHLDHICIITYKNIWGKVRSDIKHDFNHNWLKINGQKNYICYTCSKFYFPQFSENWKDYILVSRYCLSLYLSSFSAPLFFDILLEQ